MEGASEVQESLFRQVYQLISDQEDKLTELSKKDLVLFIGPTGAGKSTLISSLLGVPMRSVRESGRRILKEQDEKQAVPHPVIGHDLLTSCTSYPNAYLQRDADLYFCDTAGLQPNRPDLKLFTDIFIHQAPSIRAIAVVLTQGALLDNRGAGFKEVIKEMCSTFSLQQIRPKLLFVYNKMDPRDSLRDLFDQLCTMEDEARQKLGKSLDFNDKHMQMFELIMDKADSLEKNCFERFQQFNIVCSDASLLDAKREFHYQFLSMLKTKSQEGTRLKMSMSQPRRQLYQFITRSLIRMQINAKECMTEYSLYRQAVAIKKCRREKLPQDQQSLERIMNTALLTSERELEAAIEKDRESLQALRQQEDNVVKELIVTNSHRNAKGEYEFRIQLKENEVIEFSAKEGVFDQQEDKATRVVSGVFRPNKHSKGFEGRIQIKDTSNYKIQSFLEKSKAIMESACLLRKNMQNEKDWARIIDSKANSTVRAANINDYISNVLLSRRRMMEKALSPADFARYNEEYYVLKFIKVGNSHLIGPKNLQDYQKTAYLYSERKEQLELRCCVHSHLIEEIRQLECGHFIEQECRQLHQNGNGFVKCGLCQKQCRVLPEIAEKKRAQAVQNSFNKAFGF